jgi:hypothetical protein
LELNSINEEEFFKLEFEEDGIRIDLNPSTLEDLNPSP